MKFLLYWLLAIDLIAFCTFGWDKRCAKKDRRRVRESTLLWLCALGGALGGLLAMRLFHHKTRKKPFFIGVPLMLAAQVGLAVWLMWATQNGVFLPR